MTHPTDEQAANEFIDKFKVPYTESARELIAEDFLAGCRHVREGDLRVALAALENSCLCASRGLKCYMTICNACTALTRLRGADVEGDG